MASKSRKTETKPGEPEDTQGSPGKPKGTQGEPGGQDTQGAQGDTGGTKGTQRPQSLAVRGGPDLGGQDLDTQLRPLGWIRRDRKDQICLRFEVH